MVVTLFNWVDRYIKCTVWVSNWYYSQRIKTSKN